jgi:protein-tyrosine phosphatase
MAAFMLQAEMPGKKVCSAGIQALVHEPADATAVILMRERGLDLDRHRARQLDEELLRGCDLLLVMERNHIAWIEAQWPQARGRVYRWGHWSDFDVPDPYRRGEDAFREALALVERGLDEWKERL